MRNVLVTGGAGFIGSNFIRNMLSLDQEIQIINIDKLTYAGSLENLEALPNPAQHKFIEGDICDSPLLIRLMNQYEIDTIVNFAAETHVDRSILNPVSFVQTNIVGTFTLLEAAKEVWGEKADLSEKRFHHVSTDEVFGSLSPNALPFTEKTPYDPRSPYSASKAGSDHLVRSYYHTYQLPVTISNCSNNYGPFQFPEKLIPLMIMNATKSLPLPIYGDGKQIRDWLYVDDHCEAIRLILENGLSGETYILGGGNQLTNKEVISQICFLMDEYQPNGSPHIELIKYVDDRLGHDRRYAMDSSKIQTELGWKPRFDFFNGLRTTVEWYLSNMEWIDAIMGRPSYKEWLVRNYSKRSNET